MVRKLYSFYSTFLFVLYLIETSFLPLLYSLSNSPYYRFIPCWINYVLTLKWPYFSIIEECPQFK